MATQASHLLLAILSSTLLYSEVIGVNSERTAFVGPKLVPTRNSLRLVQTYSAPPLRCARRAASGARMGIDIPLGGQNDGSQQSKPKQYDVLLGQLAFSNPRELPKLVETNLANLDDKFFEFVDAKIAQTRSTEESETLTLLKEAVIDLRNTILKAIKQGAVGGGGGITDLPEPVVLEQFSEEEVALSSYDRLIEDIVKSPNGLASAVEAVYDRFDMRFLERLSERLEKAEGGERETLGAINSAIQSCMTSRIQKASQALQSVLRAGNPDAMSRQLMLLNAKGGLDSNVIMLLEANIDQAQKAGAAQAVEVMSMLKNKAMEFKDQSMPDEVRVIRQLLRTEDESARRAILSESFKPRESVFLADGKKSKSQAVDGRKFVKALGTLMEKFGNVEPRFLEKLQSIAREAQEVATELFEGDVKDVKTKQDEAWKNGAVSVWDLETLEESFEKVGDKAPWYSPSSGGWDENGNMVIGGDAYKKKGTGKGDSNIIF